MGVTKVDEIEDLLEKADFVTLHLPKTEKTANLLSAERIARMKPGARLINCARGGLVDEVALAAALESGQENVALQVAEQMSAYLMVGAISNALNAPSVTAEEAPVLKPWIELCELLGGFAGQVTDNAIKEIEVEFVGDVASMNLRPLMAATTASLLLPLLGEGGVNMVSAPIKAREMGIKISETRRDAQGAFGSYIRLIVTTEKQQRAVAGTIYSDGRPRFINLEAEPMPNMLYTTNTDMPGFIGALGTQLGALNINIATFALGRANKAGEAIALIGIDETLDAAALAAIEALPQVRQAKYLRFARYSS